MMNLFVYGTLMWPEVMAAVAGRSLEGRPAVLDGVRRVAVRGEVYPALISGGDSIDGILYQQVTEQELAALDHFEGAEYDRRTVTVRCGDEAVQAGVYFASDAARPMLDDRDWTPASLSPDKLQQFRSAYKGWR
jgi:gamma-glutamylcyclotransferase (GGCT)/AIG2-like uncharacterized protein YtfP